MRIEIKMTAYEFAIFTDKINEVRKRYATIKQAVDDNIEKYKNAVEEDKKMMSLISNEYTDSLMTLFRKCQDIAMAIAWDNFKQTNNNTKKIYNQICIDLKEGTYEGQIKQSIIKIERDNT